MTLPSVRVHRRHWSTLGYRTAQKHAIYPWGAAWCRYGAGNSSRCFSKPYTYTLGHRSAGCHRPWLTTHLAGPSLPLHPQRLQRFSTYGHLKQMVLKMIVDEMSGDNNNNNNLPLIPADGVSPTLLAGLQVS